METNKDYNDYVLSFPTIKKHMHISRFYRMIKYTTIFISVIAIILISLKYAFDKGIIFIDVDKSVVMTSVFVFIFFFIFTLLLRLSLKRFDYTGEIKMQSDTLTVDTLNVKQTFYLSELKNFTVILNYSSFNPSMFEVFMLGTWVYWFGFYTGTGNFIQFYYKGDFYRFEIYLQGISQINLFKTRIREWHRKHYYVRTITD